MCPVFFAPDFKYTIKVIPRTARAIACSQKLFSTRLLGKQIRGIEAKTGAKWGILEERTT